jgi:hypothetical protein
MEDHPQNNTSIPRLPLHRPLIDYRVGMFTHNTIPCRVVMTREKISVGCSDVTIEAAKELLKLHEEKFAELPERIVIQS